MNGYPEVNYLDLKSQITSFPISMLVQVGAGSLLLNALLTAYLSSTMLNGDKRVNDDDGVALLDFFYSSISLRSSDNFEFLSRTMSTTPDCRSAFILHFGSSISNYA